MRWQFRRIRRQILKKLSASDNIYRLRVADWRVVYLVEDKKMLVYIQKISTRGGVYK